MSQIPGDGSAIAGRQKESTGSFGLGIGEKEGDLYGRQSNRGSTSPLGLRGGVEASTSPQDIEGFGKAGNDGEPESNMLEDDVINNKSTQELSLYHPPYYGGKTSWENHTELVFLAGKGKHRAKPEVLKFSDADVPKGPFTDLLDTEKMRLWRSGTDPVSPNEALEAATKRIIDLVADLGKKERLIRDRDRDIETIKNYARELKTEYEQEIQKKNAEIQTLKVSFKGSLSPLQPFYPGRSGPGEKEYEQRIQKKDAEIQALKASLRESMAPVQGPPAPRTQPLKPSKPIKTTTLLEIANRTNKNLLKARAGVHIIWANNSLRESAYRDAHESAFRAEKIIEDHQLERDFSYARVIFCKAQAEYGLGRVQVAAELFSKARSHGIGADDIDPWIEKCKAGGEPKPHLGYLDYLRDCVDSGLLRSSSVRSFGSGNNTPVRSSGPATPRTPPRGSWLLRTDSFQIFRARDSPSSLSATGTPTRTGRVSASVVGRVADGNPNSGSGMGTPAAMYSNPALVSETGSPSRLNS